ncbi:substrate-binding domain-containing protein [Mesorhizobium yinganensis]|uniref:substrate-binding domain-containing protein n=1 Tax=Mesorhizobium yinganensis TaxID=3157707 RepID=UPI0032B74E45
MIRGERERIILDLLEERGVVSLKMIETSCPDTSSVSLRRDLARLEREGRLRRSHGGAVRIEHAAVSSSDSLAEPPLSSDDFDALVLPPVKGQWAHTLRQQAMRRGISLIAESAPQIGGIYLGPPNLDGAKALGHFAGERHARETLRAEVLLVALGGGGNTRDRVEGFRAGFVEAFGGEAVFHHVDGRGLLKEVVRQAADSFMAHPGINVVFGVNDHTILGTLEVAERLGRNVSGYSVGGEGSGLFDELARGKSMKAVCAFFPDVVGRLAVDTACKAFAGDRCGGEVITPAEIITAETLPNYYDHDDGQWRLRPDVLARMCGDHLYDGPPVDGKRIGFMLHYPSHDWYRGLAAAMRKRALEVGATLIARNAEDEVAEQLRAIRRTIGAAAARDIGERETLLIDGGECSRRFAEALKFSGKSLSVYTNSLDVLDVLAGTPNITVFLTAGEYQPSTRSLVGPSVGTLLETIRVDKAILSPDGISPGFGISFDDERAALVCRRFCAAARQAVVLADHGVIGLESSVQAVRPNRLHTVYTDAGTLSAHRLELSATGLGVIVVDEDELLFSGEEPAARMSN